MVKRKFFYSISPIVIAAFFLLVLVGAPTRHAHSEEVKLDGFGTVVIPPGAAIEIAIANSNIFPEAADLPLAVTMAIMDYGPIKGFSAQTLEYDTGCDGVAAAAVAATIVANPQHVGVIGPLCSSSAVGALPIFEAAGFIMISGSTTGMDLHTFGPTVFNRTVIEDPAFMRWTEINGGLASVRAFESEFESLYSRAPWEIAAYVYDATLLLLSSIDEVSTVDGSGNLVIDRQALASAVRATTDLPGVTGNIALHTTGTRVNEFQTSVWTDGFNDPVLNPSWAWIDEDPAGWSLTENPGNMRIYTQWPTQNRLVRSIPDGDFEIRTKLVFTPTENFQFAGLTIYLGEGDVLNFGRAYCDFGPPTCLDNAIYFDMTEGGVFAGDNFAMTTTMTAETYLRIVHEGTDYHASVSTNGTNWIDVGTHAPEFEPTYIGLYASGQTSMLQTPADFDFFILESAVKNLFLPIMNH